MSYLDPKEVEKMLAKPDLSARDEHAISMIVGIIKNKLSKKYDLPAEIQKGERVVNTDDNYYILGYDDSEVTLGTKYTKYLDKNTVLRTQMTSVIPGLLRQYDKDLEGDKLWLCPGVVYRRDVRDKTHVGEPHQMDIWKLTKTKQTREDLIELVNEIVSVIEEQKKEKIKWRFNETNHNYTEGGIEVEIFYKGNWLEILECGLICPKLLAKHNLEGYSGLALGMGLERMTMIIKDIEDIRILYSEDERIQKQLSNLKKYKQVSNQPAIKRDLSVAIDENITEEELTEMILNSISEQNHRLIESIKVTAETPYDKLPEIAIERLGISPGQKNVLFKITLRDLEKTLESNDANAIYEEIYGKIHQGTAGYEISYKK